MGKYGSRKFWIQVISMCVLSALPILYAVFQVSPNVQMLVLGCIASTTLGYSFANILEKKITGRNE